MRCASYVAVMSGAEFFAGEGKPLNENVENCLASQSDETEQCSKNASVERERNAVTVIDADKENNPAVESANQPSTSSLNNISPLAVSTVSGTQLGLANFNPHVQYQMRRPVEAWKYKELKSDDGTVVYACNMCSSVYKHKKSLNKHWKDKHSGSDSNEANETMSNLSVSTDFLDASPYQSVASRRSREGMRTSLRRAPSEELPTMVKRRRSVIPITSVATTFDCAPLDLSMTQGRRDESVVREENELETSEADEAKPPMRNRAIITDFLQYVLDMLRAEPPDVVSIDAISPSALALLKALCNIIVVSTNRVSEPVVANNARSRSRGSSMQCPFCNYVGRWQSELKGHMVNHSNHKMFGCSFCAYRSKWKWDVVKHMRHCHLEGELKNYSDEALVHFIIFHAPPPNDILHMYFSNEASSSSVTVRGNQQEASVAARDHSLSMEKSRSPPEVEVNSSVNDSNLNDGANIGASSQTSTLTSLTSVLKPAVKVEDEDGVEDEQEQR